MRRILLVPTLLVLASCAAADPGEIDAKWGCSLNRLAEMPLETHGDLLFVRGKILGAPVLLLVDTGAERTRSGGREHDGVDVTVRAELSEALAQLGHHRARHRGCMGSQQWLYRSRYRRHR